ncbi:hypothetical protein OAO87_00035 [bacterium]|nr:hypothetical protein [bacterium]
MDGGENRVSIGNGASVAAPPALQVRSGDRMCVLAGKPHDGNLSAQGAV